MKKTEHCPFCSKNAYHRQIKKMTLRYRSYSITVRQPAYWCDKCGEGVISSEDRKATQKELQAFRAQVDGLLPPLNIPI